MQVCSMAAKIQGPTWRLSQPAKKKIAKIRLAA
jgi:hypothetical protein